MKPSDIKRLIDENIAFEAYFDNTMNSITTISISKNQHNVFS